MIFFFLSLEKLKIHYKKFTIVMTPPKKTHSRLHYYRFAIHFLFFSNFSSTILWIPFIVYVMASKVFHSCVLYNVYSSKNLSRPRYPLSLERLFFSQRKDFANLQMISTKVNYSFPIQFIFV